MEDWNVIILLRISFLGLNFFFPKVQSCKVEQGPSSSATKFESVHRDWTGEAAEDRQDSNGMG